MADLVREEYAKGTRTFAHWKLAGVDLSNAQLAEASFFGADLSGAILYDTDFSGADLTQADLEGQIWQGQI